MAFWHNIHFYFYSHSLFSTGEKRSLAGFSKEAQAKMNQESIFIIFCYALQDSYGNYMDEPAGKYADTICLMLPMINLRKCIMKIVTFV